MFEISKYVFPKIVLLGQIKLVRIKSKLVATNKRKIVNDPVYGFININSDLLFDLIEHSFFQRLRRIRQLGLTNFVYPGATHTRFQHALGAMHLMELAIEVLRSKGLEISDEEAEAVSAAILLHDIGHGPFSHALENSIVQGITHEQLSDLFMQELNVQLNGRLNLALKIFNNSYHKKFLYQLVSGQLDMDRLDYLRRDSFFTGVTEGVVGSDRIIKMLNVVNDHLVVEAKGIYSIEKFLIARRLMYWQVYLHKTVLSAENLLVMILKRAKELASNGTSLFATPALAYFLYNSIDKRSVFETGASGLRHEVLLNFNKLDDNDILAATKVWSESGDKVLALLCQGFIDRKLFKIEMSNQPFNPARIDEIREKTSNYLGIDKKEAEYFVFSDSVWSSTYSASAVDDKISILYNSGEMVDISEASDILNMSVLSKGVTKYFLCYPKKIKEL
jgi:uncharacterized protein